MGSGLSRVGEVKLCRQLGRERQAEVEASLGMALEEGCGREGTGQKLTWKDVNEMSLTCVVFLAYCANHTAASLVKITTSSNPSACQGLIRIFSLELYCYLGFK